MQELIDKGFTLDSLKLRPGDRLVVKSPVRLSSEQCLAIKNGFKDVWPDVVVLQPGWSVEVRPDTEALRESMKLPDYDKYIIDAIVGTLRKWIDKKCHDVVWLHRMDIDQLEQWATQLAKQYRDHETFTDAMISELEQPNEGWTPAEPWPHK